MASLKEMRLARAWSQVELAERAGVTEQTILRLERGRHRPKLATIKALAGAFGMTPEAFIIAMAEGDRASV